MAVAFILNALLVNRGDVTLQLEARVDLCWWRRDTAIPLRVKILAWLDRATAQTAATRQDSDVLRRTFKRTLLSPSHTNAHAGVFLFSLLLPKRTVLSARLLERSPFLCGFSGHGARLHSRDAAVTGAVRRSWRTAGRGTLFASCRDCHGSFCA